MRTVSKRSTILRRCAATSGLTLLAGFAGTAHAQAVLPVGGTVTSGDASIRTAENKVAVTQTSTRAIISWNSFDVGAGNKVVFLQPDASSATLNRVTGTTGSTIAGQIVANGAVYLVNPNGIAITASGSVQTGGGFVASTLDIADGDFNAGRLAFAGTGASKGVSNAGTITAGAGGYVALLGGTVSNAGTISVPLGKVALGSGERLALDLNGDGFLQVALPSDVAGRQITSSGSISASGGRIELKAATARDLVRSVIKVTGSLNADSATGNAGSIVLHGGDGGTVTAIGTLSAKATGATGNGGLIETSGATVDFVGVKVDTTSVGGTTGTWLIDPEDLTVDAAAAANISTALASSNVTLQTTSTTASTTPGGLVTPTAGGAGDITINSAITWSSANTLSLLAYNTIALNAAITGTAGGLTLTAGNNVANTGAITAPAAVNVGLFTLANGNWKQLGATLPAFAARDFRLSVGAASFVRAAGGNGSAVSPYTIVDVYGLQGIASSSLLGSSFTLANAIDASGTANWNGGAGFVAIGTNGAGSTVSGGYSGSFNGAGLAISGLVINRPSDNNQGLFGYTTGSITYAVLTGGSVTGKSFVGSLIGYARPGATVANNSSSARTTASGNVGGLIGYTEVSVSNSSASGAVSGGGTIGGLIGYAGTGTSVTGSSATGTVTGTGVVIGGLIGSSNGAVSTSFATGAVLGSNTVGGLIGQHFSASTIDQTYATGTVTSTGSGGYNGGLIGYAPLGARISRSYATGAVSGPGLASGGLIGAGNATITQSYATGAVSGATVNGGVVGRLSGGSIANSVYWDKYSTGQSVAVGMNGGADAAVTVTSDPEQSAAANYAYKTGAYASLTAADWVFFDGQTRPFGAWEAVAPGGTIVTSHQLQLIGRADAAALAGSYTLGRAIDLSETGRVVVGTPGSYSGMWAGTGFVAIGTDGAGSAWTGTNFSGAGGSGFTGSFNGGGLAISGLMINRTANYQGLFGWTSGSGSIVNVVLAGGSVRGAGNVGSLIGRNTGTAVAGASSSANVTGTGGSVGGLIGVTQGTSTSSSASGTVTGTSFVGGLIGNVASSAATVTGSSATGNVTGTGLFVGGLIGVNNAAVSTSFATGAVGGVDNVGGLIGYHTDTSTIDKTYASGAVTATGSGGYAGGLIGQVAIAGGAVSRSYATGSVTGPGVNGGLIGLSRATVTQSYATGFVSGGTYNGGVIGSLQGGSLAGSVYWDTYSTGQAAAIGTGSGGTSAARAVTSDPGQASALTYAYKTGAYTGIGGLTSADWVFFDGQTRPFGAWEVVAPGGTIINSHQLQLIGANAATLAGSYRLAGDIDLGETGWVANGIPATTNAAGVVIVPATAAGTPGSYSGMWAPTGFVSLGTNGAGLTWDGSGYSSIGTITSGVYGYSGTFDGGGYALSNLFINRANTANTGLFGTVSGTIRNVTVGGTVTGGNGTGGLVGMLIGGPTTSTTGLSPVVSNARSSVRVTGLQVVGGLVGSAGQRSSVLNSTAVGTVRGTNTVGGLIGSANRATVTGSASGAVSGQGYVGGLIGQQFAGTTIGYATGAVTGTIAVGGLIGVLDGTATERGTATATRAAQSTSGPSTADRNFGRVTANGTVTTPPAP